MTLEPEVLAVTVGRRVWCGIDVTILAGVSIGDDVALAAGSVVAKSIRPIQFQRVYQRRSSSP